MSSPDPSNHAVPGPDPTPAPEPSHAPPSATAPPTPDPSPPPPPVHTPKPDPGPAPGPDPGPNPGPGPGPAPDPTQDPGPAPPGKTKSTRLPKGTPGPIVPSPLPGGSGNGGNGNNGANNGTLGAGEATGGPKEGSSSNLAGPIVGGIAGVLVLAFLVGVFMMRYKKKTQARQRRLDILLDQDGQGQDQVQALGFGGSDSGAAAGVPGKGRPESITGSGRRPSTHLEMNAIGGGAAAAAAHQQQQQHPYRGEGYDNYDYQQGYQQVPYTQYQEQYDQYDPYYQQPSGQLPPVGYYHPESSPHLQQQQQPYGAPSPSVTHAVSSPSPIPSSAYHPPPMTASPHIPQSQVSADYGGSQLHARSPQEVHASGRPQ